MKSSILEKENGTVKIEAVVEKEEWLEAQGKAFQKVKAKLKLKGFRDGASIPDAVAKPHINQADVLNEGINVILPTTFEKSIEEQKVTPFMQPEVEVTKVSNEELTFVFVIPVAPEVKLGNYKGFKASDIAIEVKQEEVDAIIKNLAAQNAELVLSEEPAKLGDTVVFDFTGYTDNKEFEGGSATNYSLELGSGQFIPGFEEQLIGVKAEEEKNVNVTFPTQYVKELAGKEALFKCKIHEIKTKLVPEINDEFVKTLNIEGVETIETLKSNKEIELVKQKEANATQQKLNEIIGKIVAEAEVVISDKLVEKEVSVMKEDMNNKLQQSGLTLEQYLEITNTELSTIEDNFKKEAQNNLKSFLTLQKIAEVESLVVSDKDIDLELEKMSKQYNMEVEQIKNVLGNNINNLKSSIQQGKIEEFIKTNNNL